MRNSGHIFKIVTAFKFLTIIPLPFGAPPGGSRPSPPGPDTGHCAGLGAGHVADHGVGSVADHGVGSVADHGVGHGVGPVGGHGAGLRAEAQRSDVSDIAAQSVLEAAQEASVQTRHAKDFDAQAANIDAQAVGYDTHATNFDAQAADIDAQARNFEKAIGGSTAWYPLVGVFQGAVALASCQLLGRIFPPEIAAALALSAIVLSNGGFHLDGLSDTFDALASRKPRLRKLEIMKDSVAGPIGVTAVALVLLVKYLALAYLFKAGYAWLSFVVFSVGKCSVVPAAWHGESARKDGLGRVIIENTGVGEVILAGALTVSVMALTAYVFGGGANAPLKMSAPIFPPIFPRTFAWTFAKMLAIIPAAYAFSYLSARFCRAKFGGLTGDTFGALIELTEAFVLIYFTSVAWI
jgi:adenosylcobinamide-GDP ribazoletransferase